MTVRQAGQQTIYQTSREPIYKSNHLPGTGVKGGRRRGNECVGIKRLSVGIPGKKRKPRTLFCKPGLRYGLSPARAESQDTRMWLDRVMARCLTYRARCQYTEARSSTWLCQLKLQKNRLSALTPLQLDADRAALVQQMHQDSISDKVRDSALAHALVAAEKSHKLVARSNQCLAARAMLDGHFVEMATGEGKTLSVALAAGAAALGGTPVHVLTANDYLAARDATHMEPVFQLLGLRVDSVVSTQDTTARRRAYTADIVYVTAKQVAFDWLSDAQTLGASPDSLTARLAVLSPALSRKTNSPMLRGLCLAIVDEADSLLVDEARIPLVLAAAQGCSSSDDTEAVIALGLAEHLHENVDYKLLSATRVVKLTDIGRQQLADISGAITHVWQSSRYREERVEQALSVLHRFKRDHDYIVRDGRLELMDAHTGRAMPDRRLPHGLHRLLELKENCKPSSQHETVATVPFQHFFKRYMDLVGISGTMHEVADEIHHVYDRLVVHVAPNCPDRRENLPALAFRDHSTQLQAMLDEVQTRQRHAQPVLVCTRSVEQSEQVSALLSLHGVSHQVLNAYQDADEAEIVAGAGQPGKVTVATNMAGRGTDIPLGATVDHKGGLHVISLAFNDAYRLDRQLAGRAARQGDSGSFQQFSSLDDPYLLDAMPTTVRRCAQVCVKKGWRRAAILLIRHTQICIERKHKKQRVMLYQSRQTLEQQLAFSGKREPLS